MGFFDKLVKGGGNPWLAFTDAGKILPWNNKPPEAPNFFDAAQKTSQGNRPSISGPFGSSSWNGNQLNMSLGDPANNPIYNQAKTRLDPMWNQRDGALQSRLANQGLDPSGEAATNATAQFGRDRNDAYQGAQNAASQQQLQGLMAMAMPGLTQGPNYLGAAGMQGQFDMGRWQGQNQQYGDFFNGLASLGGSLAGMG